MGFILPKTKNSLRSNQFLKSERSFNVGSSSHTAPQVEIDRRRTLAIIAHPDAGKITIIEYQSFPFGFIANNFENECFLKSIELSGKTTLTEKILLYGGAVQAAGSVRTRKDQRTATSDWMELEKQRGISITSTVLNFNYLNKRVNLLDTPGHQDFCEDTYRTLAASDNAVCLIDAAKGLEAQTRKLLEVCLLSKLPILTFVNKLDRPSRDPLEIMDQIESEFGLACYPLIWPIGDGDQFRGVLDRSTQLVHLFEKGSRTSKAKGLGVMGLNDTELPSLLGVETFRKLSEDNRLTHQLFK